MFRWGCGLFSIYKWSQTAILDLNFSYSFRALECFGHFSLNVFIECYWLILRDSNSTVVSFVITQYGFVGHWMNTGRDTIGALDLGGASTQITFETSEKVENKSNTMELKLFGKTYRLYTQSFLCYGQDQYLRKLLAHLIKVLFNKLKDSNC